VCAHAAGREAERHACSLPFLFGVVCGKHSCLAVALIYYMCTTYSPCVPCLASVLHRNSHHYLMAVVVCSVARNIYQRGGGQKIHIHDCNIRPFGQEDCRGSGRSFLRRIWMDSIGSGVRWKKNV